MISLHKQGNEQKIKLRGVIDSTSLKEVFDLIGNISHEVSKVCIDATEVKNSKPADLIVNQWASLTRSFLEGKMQNGRGT